MKMRILAFIWPVVVGFIVVKMLAPHAEIEMVTRSHAESSVEEEIANRSTNAQPRESTDSCPVEKPATIKREIISTKPEAILKASEQESLFDSDPIMSNVNLDFTESETVQVLSKENEETTYLVKTNQGIEVERTYDSDGNLKTEKWQDATGATVERHYYDEFSYIFHIDKSGLRKEIGIDNEGNITSKGMIYPDGRGVAHYYSKEGKLNSVFVSGPNE